MIYQYNHFNDFSFHNGQVSVLKTPIMKVTLTEEQTLDQALSEFNHKTYHSHYSRWYKRRYGYYEKPSQLKRKRKKMQKILRSSTHLDYATGENSRSFLQLKIGLAEQFARTGQNAVGK